MWTKRILRTLLLSTGWGLLGSIVIVSFAIPDVGWSWQSFIPIFLSLSALFVIFSTFFLVREWKQGRRLREIARFMNGLEPEVHEERGLIHFEEDPAGIVKAVNNLSRRFSRELARSLAGRERLEAIIRAVPDALLIIGKDDRIEIANETARKIFRGGDAPGDLVGLCYYEVVRSPELYSLIDKARESGESVAEELRVELPEERFYRVMISPLRFGEKGDSMVALFHDVTQIRMLERMRTDFVANVSHEIKTPVTAIKGFAETLLDGAIDDRNNALHFLRTIQKNSERLNRLVEDLLMLSRVELGEIQIMKEEVTAGDIFEHVRETLSERAAAKGLDFRVSLPEGDLRFSADRNRTIQIFLNLADNAIKFTEKGSVELGAERGNGSMMLYVKDTGTGIPGDLIPRLGERFFRVDPSRSRELGGTGLGLAIVKHLVRAQGWDMEIRSRESAGTEVRVIISLNQA